LREPDYVPISALSNSSYSARAPGLTGPLGPGKHGHMCGGSRSA
jgi:hypothetical protein